MDPPTPDSTSREEEEEERNWQELPRDVTSMILSKLNAVEILSSAQFVCSFWRKLCREPMMWRNIDMHNLGDLCDLGYDLEEMARHAVDRSGGQLLSICIDDFATDNLLNYIIDRSSHIRHLRLVSCYGISDDGLSEGIKRLPLLVEIDLCYCSFSKEVLEAIGQCCPQLKSFRLNCQGFRHPHIECDEEALAIAQNMPGLKSLQLEFGERCAEQIKILRYPNDSTDDYEFDAEIHDDASFDEEYPSGISDLDLLSDGDYYDFSDGSDFSEYDPSDYDPFEQHHFYD
ncbi:F-box protein SKIP19 [Vitis vinifera]|uniref:F-box protein SKIP19 n=1 Tax=Vitis vinifera TaxID=29760 RepID=A0A438IP27_VITVI|nr:F-box protein SKIP19 [Vitis vinifera]